jgi:hypothetical protein
VEGRPAAAIHRDPLSASVHYLPGRPNHGRDLRCIKLKTGGGGRWVWERRGASEFAKLNLLPHGSVAYNLPAKETASFAQRLRVSIPKDDNVMRP